MRSRGRIARGSCVAALLVALVGCAGDDGGTASAGSSATGSGSSSDAASDAGAGSASATADPEDWYCAGSGGTRCQCIPEALAGMAGGQCSTDDVAGEGRCCATDDWPRDGSCECLSVGCVVDDAGCTCGVVSFGVPESAILSECQARAPGFCCQDDSDAAPSIDGACFCPDAAEGGCLDGYVEVASCSAATLVCASALRAVDVCL